MTILLIVFMSLFMLSCADDTQKASTRFSNEATKDMMSDIEPDADDMDELAARLGKARVQFIHSAVTEGAAFLTIKVNNTHIARLDYLESTNFVDVSFGERVDVTVVNESTNGAFTTKLDQIVDGSSVICLIGGMNDALELFCKPVPVERAHKKMLLFANTSPNFPLSGVFQSLIPKGDAPLSTNLFVRGFANDTAQPIGDDLTFFAFFIDGYEENSPYNGLAVPMTLPPALDEGQYLILASGFVFSVPNVAAKYSFRWSLHKIGSSRSFDLAFAGSYQVIDLTRRLQYFKTVRGTDARIKSTALVKSIPFGYYPVGEFTHQARFDALDDAYIQKHSSLMHKVDVFHRRDGQIVRVTSPEVSLLSSNDAGPFLVYNDTDKQVVFNRDGHDIKVLPNQFYPQPVNGPFLSNTFSVNIGDAVYTTKQTIQSPWGTTHTAIFTEDNGYFIYTVDKDGDIRPYQLIAQ